MQLLLLEKIVIGWWGKFTGDFGMTTFGDILFFWGKKGGGQEGEGRVMPNKHFVVPYSLVKPYQHSHLLLVVWVYRDFDSANQNFFLKMEHSVGEIK